MSALHTQVSAETPRVLLLGDFPAFFQRVREFFGQHQLETYDLSLKELVALDSSSFTEDAIYKIVWWADFSQVKDTLETVKFLAQFPTLSLVVVGEVPENFVFLGEEQEKNVLAQETFGQVVQSLPQAQFFFLRDFFSEETLPSFFPFVLRAADQNILLDPEKEVFFTDLESLFQTLQPAFFRPHTPQKIRIQGKTTLSTKSLDFLTELVQKYYGVTMEGIPVVASRQSPAELEEFLPVVYSCDSKKYIDLIAQAKAEWGQYAAPLPSSVTRQNETSERSSPSSKQSSPLSQFETESSLNAKGVPASQEATKSDDWKSDSAFSTRSTKPTKKAEKMASGTTATPSDLNKKLINQSKYREETEIEPEISPDGVADHIESKLSRLFQKKREEKNEKRIDDKVKIVKKISEKSRKNKVLFLGGMAVMILGGTTLALWLMLEVTSFFARREGMAYFHANTPAKYETYTRGFWPDFLEKQVHWYTPVAGDLLGEKKTEASFFHNLEQLHALRGELQKETENYVAGILGSGEAVPRFPASLQALIGQLQQQSGELETSLSQVFPEENSQQQAWGDFLENSQQKMALVEQLSEFFTRFLGGEGKKTYAVLLQNNLELRPTGGFLQAIALLTFDKGLLIDSQVLGTDDIDRGLPGAVAAPEEIQRYLGEKNWYVRDGNWDPDFPVSAVRISWFIKESLKKQVDGVIALNYYSIQNILGAVGPLEVPEYGETLTKDNILERVEFHSDTEFTKTSDGKDYSQLLLTHLLQLLRTSPRETIGKLPEALYTSLSHKNTLLYFLEEKNQSVMQKVGWGGEIVSPDCPQRFPQTNCIVEPFYQVETNIGLNRVNEYIHRTIQHRVDFSGSLVRSTRTVTFQNTASSEGWPLGTYKTYIRFISPKNTNPKELRINGQKVDPSRVQIYQERNKKVVGFPLEVPKGATVTIHYIYDTEQLPDEPFSFLLFDQKQPGVERTDLSTTFYFPGKKPTLIAPQGSLVGDTIEFLSSEDTHSFVGVSFQSK